MVSTRGQIAAKVTSLRPRPGARASRARQQRKEHHIELRAEKRKSLKKAKPQDRQSKHVRQEHNLCDAAAALPAAAGTEEIAEAVGVPPDGEWNLEAAYAKRFCYDHCETEWLLQCEDRWMRLADFADIQGEHAVSSCLIDRRLEEYRAKPTELRPFEPTSRAECYAALWAQVDAVIDKRGTGVDATYKIRWKLQWIEQANIGIENEIWLQESMKEMKIKLGQRCSMRVQESSADYAARRQGIVKILSL